MKYDYIIQDLEGNIRYGRCYKLNKIIVNVNRLIEKGNPTIKKYCKALKPELEKLSEPFDFHSHLLKYPEINNNLDEISVELISFIKNNRDE